MNLPETEDGFLDPDVLLGDFKEAWEHSVVLMGDPVGWWGNPEVIADLVDLPAVSWDEGWAVVYAFVLKPSYKDCADGPNRVVKVGKASGPKRVAVDHVSPSVKSSLATALLANPILWSHLGIGLPCSASDLTEWIRAACYVLLWPFEVPDDGGVLPTDDSGDLIEAPPAVAVPGSEAACWNRSPLDVLERYLRGRLGPVVEGTGSFGFTGTQILAGEGISDD